MSVVILFVCLKTIIFKELDKEKNDKVRKPLSLLNTSIPFQIDKFWVDYKKKEFGIYNIWNK